MAVFRINKTENYTVMSNYHLRDRGLSCKACGLLSKMLSLPDEWDYTSKGLAYICKDGIDSVNSALKELEEQGYLVRRRLRKENGQLGDIEYTIFERPQAVPCGENPAVVQAAGNKSDGDFPEQENPVQGQKLQEISGLSVEDEGNTTRRIPVQENPVLVEKHPEKPVVENPRQEKPILENPVQVFPEQVSPEQAEPVLGNGIKMELNNLSARIYADTYQSQREANLRSYENRVTSSSVYLSGLESTFRSGLKKKIPLDTEDYRISNISLDFADQGEQVKYTFRCHVDFYVSMFGRRFAPFSREIELTGSHRTKY